MKILWMLINWPIKLWTLLRILPIYRLNLLIQKIKKIWINITPRIVDIHKQQPTFNQRVLFVQNDLPCLILQTILFKKKIWLMTLVVDKQQDPPNSMNHAIQKFSPTDEPYWISIICLLIIKKSLWPGIEPGSSAWQAPILTTILPEMIEKYWH